MIYKCVVDTSRVTEGVEGKLEVKDIYNETIIGMIYNVKYIFP